MIVKTYAGDGRVRVTFSMPAAIWADTIHVVGDFNRWSHTANPLQLTESGWLATVELTAGKSFQYRFLVNGEEWHNDWHTDRYEPNDLGGDNSVVDTRSFGVDFAEHARYQPVRPLSVPNKPAAPAYRVSLHSGLHLVAEAS
jgi:1,4-alpha-glucan branching enzyme